MSRLEEIEARAQAATPGPWEVSYWYEWHRADSRRCAETCGRGKTPLATRMAVKYEHHATGRSVEDIVVAGRHHLICPGHGYEESGSIDEAEAEFIAHARSDVPWLLAEVRHLREKFREFVHDEWCSMTCYCDEFVTAHDDPETPP